MTPSLTPLESLLFEIVLATLAIGLPILLLLAFRFLWDRNLKLARSKDLEKLIWQLHRIASAMEHQMNLSFPAVQPGTEELHDLAYLQPHAAQQTMPAQPAAPTQSATRPASAPSVPSPAPVQAAVQPGAQQPAPPPPADQPAPLPPLERRDPSAEAPRAGVNSMFGL